MVLEKDELIERLNHEVRVLLHLVSKVRPADLDYDRLLASAACRISSNT